jgi:ATP-dependent exoDNAse (exonuclease V) beta subunit
VAITRARYGLIICGHAPTLARSPTWNYLLNFYQERGLVFSGNLDSMYPIQIDLRSCKDFMFESNFVYAEDLKGELSPHDDPRMKQYFNDA